MFPANDYLDALHRKARRKRNKDEEEMKKQMRENFGKSMAESVYATRKFMARMPPSTARRMVSTAEKSLNHFCRYLSIKIELISLPISDWALNRIPQLPLTAPRPKLPLKSVFLTSIILSNTWEKLKTFESQGASKELFWTNCPSANVELCVVGILWAIGKIMKTNSSCGVWWVKRVGRNMQGKGRERETKACSI